MSANIYAMNNYRTRYDVPPGYIHTKLHGIPLISSDIGSFRTINMTRGLINASENTVISQRGLTSSIFQNSPNIRTGQAPSIQYPECSSNGGPESCGFSPNVSPIGSLALDIGSDGSLPTAGRGTCASVPDDDCNTLNVL